MTQVQQFFDPETWTLTYVVWDEATRDAVAIDPVLDYDPAASRTGEASVQAVARFIRERALRLHYVLETHAHADHMTGSQVLRREFTEARIAIGENITRVQRTFKDFFGLPDDYKTDGSQFDRLLRDGETLQAGSLAIRTIATPGHTPACVSYLVDGRVFVGDALFMPDYGTGRCDFPDGSADDLYRSVHGRLYALPDETIVYTGHDYQPNGRPLRFAATIAEERAQNVQLREDTTLAEFVRFRQERDRGLAAPRLLLPSVQVNIDAGRLPPPAANGRRYLKIPIA